ncbi:class I SAM-dependent methyltransferase [Streptomyces pactum]|uniref:Transferase n=1 Tax=Streptomyces pactum TaxID=68249 RepID=A0A1S6JDW3_9ACTN|nr:class I SAM-dependent methyltransferase [Streptomyces pactum]AQS69956.1 transferase [Streptomyces pactum]
MTAPSAPSAPTPVPRVPPVPGYGPHREDCPWCGSRRLGHRPRREDPWRAAPGRSALERCRDCRHVFRNPPLTPGPEHPVVRAGVRLRHDLAARAMLRRHPDPESWLDVGTGDADFPRTARRHFPYTSFDGLDPTHRVLRARAVERVEEAFVGRLTDPHIAARLRARYDVVSLFHHLERVPDPRAELRAALHVLRPGGHLLVDVADPRRLLVLPPGASHPAGLHVELAARGCTVLTGPRTHRVIARKDASAP